MPRYCQQSDLERAVGGAAILVQLLDKNADNQADCDLVNQAIDAGSNELASYIQRKVDIGSISAPYPLSLVLKSADAAAFYAWKFGAYGQPIAEHIVQGYEASIRWAKDVGDGSATLGVIQKPVLDPPAKTVDYDPDGSKVSITAFRKWGFR